MSDEPVIVAWAHVKQPTTNVIGAAVKDLWLRVRPSQVEHHTIPLVVDPRYVPPPTAQIPPERPPSARRR